MQNKTVEGQISHKAFDVEKNFFFLYYLKVPTKIDTMMLSW